MGNCRIQSLPVDDVVLSMCVKQSLLYDRLSGQQLQDLYGTLASAQVDINNDALCSMFHGLMGGCATR